MRAGPKTRSAPGQPSPDQRLLSSELVEGSVDLNKVDNTQHLCLSYLQFPCDVDAAGDALVDRACVGVEVEGTLNCFTLLGQ